MGGDAGQVDTARSRLDEEQHVKGPQPRGLHGEEVIGPVSIGCERRNSVREGPSRRGAARCPPAEDRSDRGGAEPHPEPTEFALDPGAPHLGFSRPCGYEVPELGITGGRPLLLLPREVHLRRTSSRCQRRSVHGEARNDDHRSRGRSRLAAAMTLRSIRVRRGRFTPRRRTASWWEHGVLDLEKSVPRAPTGQPEPPSDHGVGEGEKERRIARRYWSGQESKFPRPTGQLDEEQHGERLQPECLHREEVGGQPPVGLCSKEPRPRRCQPEAGRLRIRLIEVAPTWIPSLRSSPLIRGYPHLWFSRAIRTMRARTSGSMGGLPGRQCG